MKDQRDYQDNMGPDLDSLTTHDDEFDTMASEMAGAETAEAAYAMPGNKRVNRGTLFLLATCMLGVGAVYTLRHRPTLVSAEQEQVEARLDNALQKLVNKNEQEKAKKVFKDTEEMVQAFYDYPAKQQVAVDELQRDPFSWLLAKDEDATDTDDALERQEQLRKELTKVVEKMQLQSVLQGARGAQCLIDGEVFAQGDTIAERFRVAKISRESVLLTASELQFTLMMR